MFHVLVKLLVGFSCLSGKKDARDGLFSGASLDHDTEGLMQGGHKVVGHTVEVFWKCSHQFLPDGLNVRGSPVFPKKVLSSLPGGFYVSVGAQELVEVLSSDGLPSFLFV